MVKKKKVDDRLIDLTPAQSRLQHLYWQATMDPVVRVDANASAYALRIYIDSAMSFGVAARDGITIADARKRLEAIQRGKSGGSHLKKPGERGEVEKRWKAWIRSVDAFPSLNKFAILCHEEFGVSTATVSGWCLEFAKTGLLTKPWMRRHGGRLGAEWQAVFSQL